MVWTNTTVHGLVRQCIYLLKEEKDIITFFKVYKYHKMGTRWSASNKEDLYKAYKEALMVYNFFFWKIISRCRWGATY